MRIFHTFIILSLFALNVHSQQRDTLPRIYEELMPAPALQMMVAEEGNIKVIADERIDSLVARHVRINKENPGFPGFRVQIFSDSGNEARKRQTEARTKFLMLYEDVPAYNLFESPNFIVRVGDFRTKLEARKFLNEISEEFPYAFIRRDMIEYPELEKEDEEEEDQ